MAGRLAAAVYLYGYAAEIRLTGACYRVLGKAVGETTRRSDRDDRVREARTLRLMSAEPHDLAGWGRYLVHVRKRELGGYARPVRDELIRRTADLYYNWRPRLRYRADEPAGDPA